MSEPFRIGFSAVAEVPPPRRRAAVDAVRPVGPDAGAEAGFRARTEAPRFEHGVEPVSGPIRILHSRLPSGLSATTFLTQHLAQQAATARPREVAHGEAVDAYRGAAWIGVELIGRDGPLDIRA